MYGPTQQCPLSVRKRGGCGHNLDLSLFVLLQMLLRPGKRLQNREKKCLGKTAKIYLGEYLAFRSISQEKDILRKPSDSNPTLIIFLTIENNNL